MQLSPSAIAFLDFAIHDVALEDAWACCDSDVHRLQLKRSSIRDVSINSPLRLRLRSGQRVKGRGYICVMAEDSTMSLPICLTGTLPYIHHHSPHENSVGSATLSREGHYLDGYSRLALALNLSPWLYSLYLQCSTECSILYINPSLIDIRDYLAEKVTNG